jgi:hypothetical protein
MIKRLILLGALVSAGCTEQPFSIKDTVTVVVSPTPVPQPTLEITQPIRQAWVMSSRWAGFMGVAIALTEKHYYYWFYSDVRKPNEPVYPLSGSYTLENGRLRLDGPSNALYDHQWILTTNEVGVCLWAPKDEGDISRLLIPDPVFEPSDPFRRQRGLRPPAR